MDVLKKVAEAHTRYYTLDGTLVPSATTIVHLLDKPALIKWANNLGLQGIDSSKYTDEAAKVGTLIHSLAESHITGCPMSTDEYSALQIELAQNGFYKYLDFEKQHKIVPIFNERAFVSENYRYGGTLDFYCELDGKKTLLDFKSGKGIYKEHFLQVSGYANLLKEKGYEVEQIMILNIGRSEDEPFLHQTISPELIDKYFEIFKHLISIYYLKKELGWK